MARQKNVPRERSARARRRLDSHAPDLRFADEPMRASLCQRQTGCCRPRSGTGLAADE